MRDETKQIINERNRKKMDDIIMRRIRELSADMRDIAQTNPFGSRLVPQEVWRGSKFERSFSTSFGTGVYEQVGPGNSNWARSFYSILFSLCDRMSSYISQD